MWVRPQLDCAKVHMPRPDKSHCSGGSRDQRSGRIRHVTVCQRGQTTAARDAVPDERRSCRATGAQRWEVEPWWPIDAYRREARWKTPAICAQGWRVRTSWCRGGLST